MTWGQRGSWLPSMGQWHPRQQRSPQQAPSCQLRGPSRQLQPGLGRAAALTWALCPAPAKTMIRPASWALLPKGPCWAGPPQLPWAAPGRRSRPSQARLAGSCVLVTWLRRSRPQRPAPQQPRGLGTLPLLLGRQPPWQPRSKQLKRWQGLLGQAPGCPSLLCHTQQGARAGRQVLPRPHTLQAPRRDRQGARPPMSQGRAGSETGRPQLGLLLRNLRAWRRVCRCTHMLCAAACWCNGGWWKLGLLVTQKKYTQLSKPNCGLCVHLCRPHNTGALRTACSWCKTMQPLSLRA